jgi:phosphatidylserine decarboxylase
MAEFARDEVARRAAGSPTDGSGQAAVRPMSALDAMVPVASEGWPFILVPLGAALLAWGFGRRRVATAGVCVSAFMAFFFRDPERTPPPVVAAVLAPADGRVLEVREDVTDPFVGPGRMVSIFLSPLDVHVNRSPIAGEVVSVEYRPGRFLPAYRQEAAEDNERTVVAIQGAGVRVVVRQVAGALARRVVCRVRPGDRLRSGERFGMIKFGSRLDVIVPDGVRLLVRPDDRVRAGETILGVWG